MVHLINTWKLMDSSHWMWGHLGQRLVCKTAAALHCFQMTNLAIQMLAAFSPKVCSVQCSSEETLYPITQSHNLFSKENCNGHSGHVWEQVWQRRFGHEHIRASGYPGRKMLRLRLRCWDVEVWKSKEGFMGVLREILMILTWKVASVGHTHVSSIFMNLVCSVDCHVDA